ncbi:hypothetical protein C2S53_009664 [Perilla frutescens var. hirtella]|uniref:Uncharacterized protein n=1 Tax=Perilla frutescens var. hirtella TaxID=608512 RepID=A0AAD4IVW0_PERFH|nr:hypothetical protein C2S53_009664 [Perilla frutescens var. hirtella]
MGKAASQLQSYIGLLARDHVKISIKNWKLVPDDTKDLIWEQVKASYNVPETWKATCLESANSKWRTWKCRMHKVFILPNKDNPDELYKPPADSGILDHDWGVFVHSHVSIEFQQLSEQQKERRSEHLYPHQLSWKCYANYAEEIKVLINILFEMSRMNTYTKKKKGNCIQKQLQVICYTCT